jgi:hypothetical protein
MSPTDHEHTWIQGFETYDLRCACGASHSAIQTTLGEAADEARKLVGEAHYTGCRVRQESEALELWLFNAPSHVLQELEAIRPGVYLIHNDAPRPRTVVDDLRDSFDWATMKSDGIEATSVGPSEDGHLLVGVMSDVPTAQAKLDAIYGAEVARVFYRERAVALPYHGTVA